VFLPACLYELINLADQKTTEQNVGLVAQESKRCGWRKKAKDEKKRGKRERMER
jgi:hypothetical protein